ncbi:reductase [Lithospermum erythrorhizon]|uniref:Reductase n=1 Tax=Lithospermum erythrorhizon TaxID=34254 RepID=A0AAV3QNN0_LITER
MGLLWWRKNNKESPSSKANAQMSDQKQLQQKQPAEAPGMNGAVEVRRPADDITIFEFGSVAASTDKVTLAGFCPVSDELEPCRWEILPASDSNAPQFRVVF